MPAPIRPKAISTTTSGQSSVYNPEYLRLRARWIRDDLDPQVARDGPDALHADDLLKLDELLRHLLTSNLSVADIRYSRMHLTVLEIAGHGTRWPNRLIDRCDALKAVWTVTHGPLERLRTLLYEPGGRLHKVCKPEDLSKERLVMKWLRSLGAIKLSPIKALRTGDLGFKPGDWWISPLFAYREGIIDHGEQEGGVVSDAAGAYALVLADSHEVASPRPDEFVFRAASSDKGRYRLTTGTPESRKPVRVLRSHTLRSFWSPKAGLRYDGLVTGWCIKMDKNNKDMVYDVTFKRLPGQTSMDDVLARPWTEEIEDYKEYKRLRHIARAKQTELVSTKKDVKSTVAVSADGSIEVFEDETADLVLESWSDESEPDWTSLRRDSGVKHRQPIHEGSISPKTRVRP